jgi:hypothetical protein
VKKKTNIGVKKIAEVVKDIRIAMMSTVDSRGQTTASHGNPEYALQWHALVF